MQYTLLVTQGSGFRNGNRSDARSGWYHQSTTLIHNNLNNYWVHCHYNFVQIYVVEIQGVNIFTSPAKYLRIHELDWCKMLYRFSWFPHDLDKLFFFFFLWGFVWNISLTVWYCHKYWCRHVGLRRNSYNFDDPVTIRLTLWADTSIPLTEVLKLRAPGLRSLQWTRDLPLEQTLTLQPPTPSQSQILSRGQSSATCLRPVTLILTEHRWVGVNRH